MKRTLVKHLVDPVDMQSLRLGESDPGEGDVLSGHLIGSSGTAYPIRAGIPRFVTTKDEGQKQTERTFGYKWKKRDTYDSDAAQAAALEWYLQKYGFDSAESWAACYNDADRILDLGCGSGFSSALYLRSAGWTGDAMWIGVDISEAIDVAKERLAPIANTHFIQADAMALPFRDRSFDIVFSEGVLHHTPSTRQALLAGARVVAPGGQFHFYVYRRKGPVREFTDDYIREQISHLSDEEAWDQMRSVTRLGQALSELNQVVEVPQDVPLLGIAAGSHDVQRLTYWHFAKLFWNATLEFEENVHVNFDWYRPRYAHRQTAAEVGAWVGEAELEIDRLFEDEAGITVRAVRG